MALNENAKKWVAALRSGEFEQSFGRLTDGHGYCCLGVACAVLGIPEKEWRELNLLPSGARESLGLRGDSGGYYSSSYLSVADHCLANDNDGGMTFFQIADIIESEPVNLFVVNKEARNGDQEQSS